jgi:hypothetical protein
MGSPAAAKRKRKRPAEVMRHRPARAVFEIKASGRPLDHVALDEVADRARRRAEETREGGDGDGVGHDWKLAGAIGPKSVSFVPVMKGRLVPITYLCTRLNKSNDDGCC